MWQDLRFGFRLIRKNWTFTAVAVLTLALGVGANGAIFSIVNAVLIRELPYPNPDDLVMVWEARPREGVFDNSVSPADFSDWRVRQQVFDDIATYSFTTLDLTGSGDPERLPAMNVSSSFLNVFRITPMLGRDFTRDEEQRGRNQVAIISHGLWQRRFGGDPSILGRKLVLSGQPFEVIGVLPAAARFPYDSSEILFPLDFTSENMRARFSHFLTVYARLKLEVTIERAQQDMDRISAQLQSEVELQNQMHGAKVVLLREQLVGNIRESLFVLLAAVGFVLLIACVNVANLLLSRTTGRYRELAIRNALGAARFRIVRQISIECLCLAALGAIAAIPIAYYGVTLLQSIVPVTIPRLNEAGLDLSVIGYMTAAALLTAMIFGLAPTIQATRVNLSDTLKQSSPSAGGSRRWLRGGFVIAQVTLAFVLLIGAGLMLRSLFNLLDVDPGFDEENILTMQLSLSPMHITPQRPASAFFTQLVQNVRALPGVNSAGLTWLLPMSGQDGRSGMTIEGREPTPNEPTRAHGRVVTPDYFTTMKIRLLEGRLPTDQELQAGALVAVINRTAANRYWPGQSPVGKRIQYFSPGWREVIGVIDDVRHWGLANPVNPEVYLPGIRAASSLVVRSSQNPEELTRMIREEVRKLEPTLPISSVQTMEQLIGRSVASPRFYLILLGVFGGLALILACAGIYGVISYTVNQSTREIGVRIAMGAKPRDVQRHFIGQAMLMTGISLIVGSAVAYGLTRVMRTLLFGVTPTDLPTFIATAATVALIALLACYIPARRAARVDPITALRME